MRAYVKRGGRGGEGWRSSEIVSLVQERMLSSDGSTENKEQQRKMHCVAQKGKRAPIT